MKPSQVIAALNVALDIHLPTFIWGPAGVGKSESVDQVATARKCELRDIRMGQMDPTDIKGFPAPDLAKGVMKWLPPDFLPPMTCKKKGILFFDEMNSAPMAVQAAAYQLFLGRRIGNYVLPAGWDIVAAGNRVGDRGVTYTQPAPLANRLLHLDYEVDTDEWAQHAAKHSISVEIVAFNRFRTELLHKFDPAIKSPAFPTPRTWFFADKIIKRKAPRDIELEMLKGCVGDDAANQFTAFVRAIRDIPTIDQIRLAPSTAEIPKSPNMQHAITTMLSMATTESAYGRFMDYVTRMPREFQAVYNRDAITKTPSLRNDPVFTKWILDNKDVII